MQEYVDEHGRACALLPAASSPPVIGWIIQTQLNWIEMCVLINTC